MIMCVCVCVCTASDASPNTMPRHGSQGGFFLLLTNKSIMKEMTPFSVIGYMSHRLKRPSPASLAAESLAVAEALKHGLFLRTTLCEILCPEFDVARWEESSSSIAHILATDCRSVYDHVARDRGLPKDRAVATELALLKCVLREENQFLRWMPGEEMISDALTKYRRMPSSLLDPIKTAMWALCDNEKCQSLRKRKQDQARTRKLLSRDGPAASGGESGFETAHEMPVDG